MSDSIDRAVSILSESKRVLAFSGAGMSAESGIPTFRDPGGLWDKFDPGEFGTSDGLISMITREPARIRSFLEETIGIFRKAAPNAGHTALARLEEMGILRTVITQNIDNLHTEAGNTRVIELHGNLFRHRCLACEAKRKIPKEDIFSRLEEMLARSADLDLESLASFLPECTCTGRMRPDVVMFGEAVQEIPEAFAEAETCDAMIIIGTSGVVYPAAQIPHSAASRKDIRIIEINPREHPFASISEVSIAGKCGEVMSEIMRRLEN